MCGHTRDPIIYSEFHRNPFRGFGAPGGQNLAFPITLASRFYNSLYYRTSRDQGKTWRGTTRHAIVPPRTCSHELLLAPDVFYLLLQLFGTNYLTPFDLLKLLEPFVPD